MNPSHAVRKTPCCAPFSARSPPCGGLFPPFLPPSAPKCRLFRPADPAVRPENPAGSPRYSPAGARFSRFPPGIAPRMPPETRPLCAVSRQARPLSPPGSPAFPRCVPADCPRVPAKRRLSPPGAPQPPALGVRRRPKLDPLGLQPLPASSLRRAKVCGPQGGLNLWERPAGDRRPLSREISRNWGPGVSSPKTRKAHLK